MLKNEFTAHMTLFPETGRHTHKHTHTSTLPSCALCQSLAISLFAHLSLQTTSAFFHWRFLTRSATCLHRCPSLQSMMVQSHSRKMKILSSCWSKHFFFFFFSGTHKKRIHNSSCPYNEQGSLRSFKSLKVCESEKNKIKSRPGKFLKVNNS